MKKACEYSRMCSADVCGEFASERRARYIFYQRILSLARNYPNASDRSGSTAG
ncbi:hypothetical protein N7530_002351 [Penicillium desertorum]|uniref:Uncharacterized protein n=1 Tax=Penicillium desertorum TaxID=1303715 RepID=A0A9W9X3W5_9EURO|nr:hypothetical protein N7530_002351 [Penicillium desertorum]